MTIAKKYRSIFISDVHLGTKDSQAEKLNNFLKHNSCDTLYLVGDIIDAWRIQQNKWRWKQSHTNVVRRVLGHAKRGTRVIYIAGNHEFYGGKWFQTLETLREECEQFNNIYFLERDTKVIDDVTFIGGTLWTDCNKFDPLTLHALRDMMQDYRCIRKEFEGYTLVKPADTCYRHQQTLDYIRKVVEGRPNDKFVVVGHHSPSFQSVNEIYKDEYLMNGGYHSDLSEFILDRPQIKLWTHGHTHHPFDYVIGETRVVCNPRGYDSYEDSGWNQQILLEI